MKQLTMRISTRRADRPEVEDSLQLMFGHSLDASVGPGCFLIGSCPAWSLPAAA